MRFRDRVTAWLGGKVLSAACLTLVAFNGIVKLTSPALAAQACNCDHGGCNYLSSDPTGSACVKNLITGSTWNTCSIRYYTCFNGHGGTYTLCGDRFNCTDNGVSCN